MKKTDIYIYLFKLLDQYLKDCNQPYKYSKFFEHLNSILGQALKKSLEDSANIASDDSSDIEEKLNEEDDLEKYRPYINKMAELHPIWKAEAQEHEEPFSLCYTRKIRGGALSGVTSRKKKEKETNKPPFTLANYKKLAHERYNKETYSTLSDETA